MADSNRTHADDLIGRYLDQCATDEETRELGGLLAADPVLSDELARACRLDVMLEQYFAQQRTEIELPRSVQPARSGIGMARRVAVAASTIAALVVMSVLFWREPVRHKPQAASEVLSGQVAVDGVATSAVPFDTSFEVRGPGTASLRLAGGADAVLEPATTAVFHRGGTSPLIRLVSGGGQFRATAGEPIQIQTSAGTILGRDTQFEVDLQETFLSGEPAMQPQALVLLTVAVLAGQVDVQDETQTVKVPVAAGERRVFSSQKVPMFSGRVMKVEADGTRLTLEGDPPKPNAPAPQRTVEISAATELSYYGVSRDGDRPTVGYRAVATLSEKSPDQAVRIEFGNPQPDISGIVVAVADDARSMTVEVFRKGDAPLKREIRLTDQTRLSYRGVKPDGERPTVDYRVEIWTAAETDRAIDARFRLVQKGAGDVPDTPRKPPDKSPAGKPAENKPAAKTDTAGKEPEETHKPQPKKPTSKAPDSAKPAKDGSPTSRRMPQPAKSPSSNDVKKPSPKASVGRVSSRDPLPVAEAVDRIVENHLMDSGVPASPLADDGEFLRRVTLDIAGRVPTYDETIAFLDSDDPHKRQKWIDALLAESSYGANFAIIWRELIGPRETGKAKTGRDPFAEWLTEQFNRNRGWNEMVDDMLTAEGKLREQPQTGFIMANSENQEPRANLVADATSRLFWGVQLRCAECHDHPFAPWKQTDFWGTAAFFSRLRKGYTDGKNPAGWTLTEAAPDESETTSLPESFVVPSGLGPAITLPASAGKQSGAIVKARFLQGEDVDWPDNGPYRPRFSRWATGQDNPFFAANAVNRLWAHFFGRGLVNPLDGFQAGNPPSHPELLARLSVEFVDSDFDLKHLIRCICNSRTYQRTSRPVAANEMDSELFSHMAVRVIRPHVLYDSLSIVLYPPVAKGGQQKSVTVAHVNPIPEVSRDEFVRFFASVADENTGSVVNQGIPQFLRLMNGSLLDDGASGVQRFAGSHDEPADSIERLYLAAYSRRPTSEELELVQRYFDGSPDPRKASSGLLWTLLNSSEFLLNH